MWNTHDEYMSGLCKTKKKSSNKIVYNAFQKSLKDKKNIKLTSERRRPNYMA